MDKGRSNGWVITEYLFLVMTIPLLCAIVILYVPAFSETFLYLMIFGIEAMAPALAAVITVAINHRKSGLKYFLRSKYIAHINFKLCVIAFLIPMAILLLAKLLSVFSQNSAVMFNIPDAKKVIIILWALIAEELGWRGFLQERIERKAGMIFTPLIVGAIWGIWHFHYFLTGNMDVPFFALMLGCIFESYGYFTITKLAGGNILPASIWHFSGNLFISICMLNPNDNGGNILPYMIQTFLYIICVICFVFYYRRRKSAL